MKTYFASGLAVVDSICDVNVVVETIGKSGDKVASRAETVATVSIAISPQVNVMSETNCK